MGEGGGDKVRVRGLRRAYKRGGLIFLEGGHGGWLINLIDKSYIA